MPRTLPNPVADTKSVRELVELVIRGRMRIPVYQRALVWSAADVLSLFDSIYRGYPIGSLLLHRRPAPATIFDLGPLKVHAAEQSLALDVVDGQQRLVALAASLMRPDPIPTTPDDNYVVYFDPDAEQFCSPPRSGEIPDTWVPLTQLLDTSKLTEWVSNWKHGHDQRRCRVVFEAGSRLREYKVPMYVVEVGEHDSQLLGDIFHRINSGGKPLKWPVIHDALYGARSAVGQPATLTELADALADLAMGRVNEQDLLRCLIAFEGLDVTRSPDEHHRAQPDFLDGTAAQALPTLRRVLGFIREHGKIPHERLLPRTAPLIVLTRFFRLHPEPTARSIELLTRWLWRSLLAIKQFDERTFQRRGVSDIDEHEEPSVQRLLAFLPRDNPGTFSYPDHFDAQAADTRITLLGLVSLTPRDLDSGQPLDVAVLIDALIDESGHAEFRRILSRSDGALAGHLANRILLPGTGAARAQLLAYIESVHRTDAILSSHAITPAAADALRDKQPERFLANRHHALRDATTAMCDRLAAWGHSDRPSIDFLLESAE
jgi:hypothetical protein